MRLLVAGLLIAFAASAQDAATFRVPTVRAHGTAKVSAKPDQVQIEIGVVTQGATAQAAAAANAKQLTDVMAELKKSLGASAQIQTSGYSLNPNYRFPREGGTPTITGFTATNVVRVTSMDLEGVGKVIDAATRTGANNIQNIQFSLKDEQAARAQALQMATQQARASAQAMAGALSMKVVRVLRIEDSAAVEVFPANREFMQARAAMVADASTPVQPGTIDVRAVVVLTAEVGQ